MSVLFLFVGEGVRGKLGLLGYIGGHGEDGGEGCTRPPPSPFPSPHGSFGEGALVFSSCFTVGEASRRT